MRRCASAFACLTLVSSRARASATADEARARLSALAPMRVALAPTLSDATAARFRCFCSLESV